MHTHTHSCECASQLQESSISACWVMLGNIASVPTVNVLQHVQASDRPMTWGGCFLDLTSQLNANRIDLIDCLCVCVFLQHCWQSGLLLHHIHRGADQQNERKHQTGHEGQGGCMTHTGFYSIFKLKAFIYGVVLAR